MDNPAKEERDERQLDSARKFAWVESQIHRVALGKTESIGCPYCFSSVTVGVDRLCCASMGEATATVLEAMETDCVREREVLRVFAPGPKPIADTDETKTSPEVNNSTQFIQ
jgi:hypothetical protein